MSSTEGRRKQKQKQHNHQAQKSTQAGFSASVDWRSRRAISSVKAADMVWFHHLKTK
jgi:hypothetical protein